MSLAPAACSIASTEASTARSGTGAPFATDPSMSASEAAAVASWARVKATVPRAGSPPSPSPRSCSMVLTSSAAAASAGSTSVAPMARAWMAVRTVISRSRQR